MKKKEYISPDFKVINLNSPRYILLSSGEETGKYKRQTINDSLAEIDGEDEELD